MNTNRALSLLLLTSLTACSSTGSAQEGSKTAFMGAPAFEQVQVFTNERFPNVVVTLEGTVLATWGASTVRARRSEDGGRSWGEEIIIGRGIQGGGTTVDEGTGDILAFVEDQHPPAPLNMYRSQDDGRSWAAEEITIGADPAGNVPSMHMNERGITLRHGEHAGRLIRPARWYAGKNDHSKWPEHYTTSIFSDDGGRTWLTSGAFPENGTGEAAIVELSDGSLYYNSRIHWDQRPDNTRRRSARSEDSRETWTDHDIVEVLPDGHQHRSYGCMGGLVRLPVDGEDWLVFSNIDTPNPTRERITVWASPDGGRTWPMKRLVFDGPGAYSSLSAGRPGTASEGWFYLHYEGGPNGGSTMARFNLAWILEGEATGDGAWPR